EDNRKLSYRVLDIAYGGIGVVMTAREGLNLRTISQFKIKTLPYLKNTNGLSDFDIARVEQYRKANLKSEELVKVVFRFKNQILDLALPGEKQQKLEVKKELQKTNLESLQKEMPKKTLDLILKHSLKVERMSEIKIRSLN